MQIGEDPDYDKVIARSLIVLTIRQKRSKVVHIEIDRKLQVSEASISCNQKNESII
jgi:hypothetical protein